MSKNRANGSKADKSAAAASELVNTSIRPNSKRLVELASPFVNESITDFISGAATSRALEILRDHNVKLPADVTSAV